MLLSATAMKWKSRKLRRNILLTLILYINCGIVLFSSPWQQEPLNRVSNDLPCTRWQRKSTNKEKWSKWGLQTQEVKKPWAQARESSMPCIKTFPKHNVSEEVSGHRGNTFNVSMTESQDRWLLMLHQVAGKSMQMIAFSSKVNGSKKVKA